jgi:hypothetical protein
MHKNRSFWALSCLRGQSGALSDSSQEHGYRFSSFTDTVSPWTIQCHLDCLPNHFMHSSVVFTWAHLTPQIRGHTYFHFVDESTSIINTYSLTLSLSLVHLSLSRTHPRTNMRRRGFGDHAQQEDHGYQHLGGHKSWGLKREEPSPPST